ncbi:peptidoglycan DD-metalloendopeptidase family protein [Laceyella putida]|uniref:Peptidoglycan DD-metalloendopeptidase family protein n=1 Tax=Laceyella putida TaxID=110101 RepID=A0ABW2RR50_9BACL
MEKWFVSLTRWSQRHRKGASTTEFVVILPLFFLLSLVVWQLVEAGMAVLETQAALRDAVKIASTTGDEEKAQDQFKLSFADRERVEIEKLEIKIEDDEVKALAKVKIPVIFDSDLAPITYESKSKAPVLQQNFAMFTFGGVASGPLLTSGGVLGPPVGAWHMTSPFGYRFHPIRHVRKLHAGIDLAGPVGTPIYAAGDGIVVKAGESNGFGNLIIIDHGNGMQTWYGHMYSNMIYVRPGQQVKRGDHIAGIGSAGGSTGPHLHFEVHIGGQPVDPLRYVSRNQVAQK